MKRYSKIRCKLWNLVLFCIILTLFLSTLTANIIDRTSVLFGIQRNNQWQSKIKTFFQKHQTTYISCETRNNQILKFYSDSKRQFKNNKTLQANNCFLTQIDNRNQPLFASFNLNQHDLMNQTKLVLKLAFFDYWVDKIINLGDKYLVVSRNKNEPKEVILQHAGVAIAFDPTLHHRYFFPKLRQTLWQTTNQILAKLLQQTLPPAAKLQFTQLARQFKSWFTKIQAEPQIANNPTEKMQIRRNKINHYVKLVLLYWELISMFYYIFAKTVAPTLVLEFNQLIAKLLTSVRTTTWADYLATAAARNRLWEIWYLEPDPLNWGVFKHFKQPTATPS